MQSKRDQVQAHLFVMGRLATGMLRGEPDAVDTPAGRTSRGSVLGLAVAVLIAVGVALYGLVVPGGATGWRKPGTLVVVKESGARYLFLDGELHPVLNEASARLLAGDQLVVDQVSVKSLDGTPRGVPVGIQGAPDGLPTAARLTGAPWYACAQSRPAPSGSRIPGLALAVGADRPGERLTEDQAVLTAAPDGAEYLLWHGRRLRLDTRAGARQALGYASATPYPVTTAFLNALPAGPDLGAPEIEGRGNPGPTLATHPTRVGQLFTGPGGDPYLLTASGLAPLGRTMFELLRGDSRTQHGAYGDAAVVPVVLGPIDLAAHPAPAAVTAGLAGQGLPAAPPQLLNVPQGKGVCAELRLGEQAPATAVTLLPDAAVTGLAPAAQPGVEPACAGADAIAVAPGGGALVRALSGAGSGSTLYLVTDTGVKFPLASAEVAKQLGYAAAAPPAVPDALLTLLPTGPSLDPALLTGAAPAPVAAQPACVR
ncbi:type VII secretion protein EccB [Kitasatospora sp. NPDC057223]|uniref:type VII secretion protein EccB n=1 Tax=Kitasatospora sp. NPDC057223 TaxID=3346055 RepID=UPI00363DBC38